MIQMLIIRPECPLHSLILKHKGLASTVTKRLSTHIYKTEMLSLTPKTKQLTWKIHLHAALMLSDGFINQCFDLRWPSLGLQNHQQITVNVQWSTLRSCKNTCHCNYVSSKQSRVSNFQDKPHKSWINCLIHFNLEWLQKTSKCVRICLDSLHAYVSLSVLHLYMDANEYQTVYMDAYRSVRARVCACVWYECVFSLLSMLLCSHSAPGTHLPPCY